MVQLITYTKRSSLKKHAPSPFRSIHPDAKLAARDVDSRSEHGHVHHSPVDQRQGSTCSPPLLDGGVGVSRDAISVPETELENPEQLKKRNSSRLTDYFPRKLSLHPTVPMFSLKKTRVDGGDSKKSRKSGKTSETSLKNYEQLYLDLGQKGFNFETCKTCSMTYHRGLPEDQAMHNLYHKRYLDGIEMKDFKLEECLGHYPEDHGKIIVITHQSSSNLQDKARQLLEIVNHDLGSVNPMGDRLGHFKLYVYLNAKDRAMGCALAEPIQSNHCLITGDLLKNDIPLTPHLQNTTISSSSVNNNTLDDPYHRPSIQCGISRIWVSITSRRKKIASRLIDTVRHHFIYGIHLSPSELAFSQPTLDGKRFAEYYTKRLDFFVYY